MKTYGGMRKTRHVSNPQVAWTFTLTACCCMQPGSAAQGLGCGVIMPGIRSEMPQDVGIDQKRSQIASRTINIAEIGRDVGP